MACMCCLPLTPSRKWERICQYLGSFFFFFFNVTAYFVLSCFAFTLPKPLSCSLFFLLSHNIAAVLFFFFFLSSQLFIAFALVLLSFISYLFALASEEN